MEVEYDPPSDFNFPSPPYYRPATPVTIICNATEAVGSVYYQWSSTSSRSFASSSTRSDRVSTSQLKSYDAGVHTCTAFDGVGNTGSQSTEMQLVGTLEWITCNLHVSLYKYFYTTRFWALCGVKSRYY